MTEFLNRGLKILTLILFLSSHSCYANTIRYVNINNATPGDGTTWAKAFNNLQAALSTATIFEDIWVAKGTYFPSAPAGRSATFSLPSYTNIYGGFDGTESTVTQRNVALNPTILSGDIGVVGDASDNCYHVVTAKSNGWPFLYDLTVADGRADAAYPGSTVQQADNTGGGVLVLSGSSVAAAVEMHNCILRDNFAVYGGGVGAYGYGGAIEAKQLAYDCMFYNNQAVYGGAMSASADGCSGLLVYESCIFNNNTAFSGDATVFASSMANTATTVQLCQIKNCLFYNEGVPLFSVQTANVPSYSYSLQYSIIWTSGTPYTGGYTSGNGDIPISSSDIDGTLPAGGNIDIDPLFVDAPGGDFHVSPCSPVIDKGYPTTYSSWANDYGGSARVQGVGIDLGPYETPLGTTTTKPVATAPAPYCQNVSAAALSATGVNVLWYTAATGGTGSSTAPTPLTTSTGTTAYYVTQTPAGSCESGRLEIDVTVKPGASVPTVVSPTYCQNATATALTATGANLLWYNAAIGGSGSATAPTPATTGSGSSYWVSQTPAGSCESIRTPVTVTITPKPTADFTWTDACLGKPALINVVATAAPQDQYVWDFGNAASSTGTGTGPYEVTYNKAGNYTVTLTATRGTCQNQVQHLVAINALPVVDISPVTTTCAGSSVALAASGASAWQWSPATGLSDPSISNPTALLQNDMLYTVTGTDANGCSATASVTLKVSPDCLGYYMPTAFSPNGDGANDVFRVKTADDPKSFSLLVFNRFGQKVFESANVGVGWNGTIAGNPAPTGAYIFVVVVTTSSGTVIKRQGTVMLVR
ncbi:MAG TPA: gliding motility-associated C-terminal domain-containing protein [Puia sp.]|jgi:gliding motility-associated-like protein